MKKVNFVAGYHPGTKAAPTTINTRFRHPVPYKCRAAAFEESLRRMAIPYTSMAASASTSGKRSRISVAYLRIIVNPRDEEALKGSSIPTRGIARPLSDRAVLAANEGNITLWEVLKEQRIWLQGRYPRCGRELRIDDPQLLQYAGHKERI